MIGADEWKGSATGKPAQRESPAVPSATGPKWTAEEVDCLVLALDACKGVPSRLHAEFNDVTTGRQRTLAELRLHLPRVAKARSLALDAAFLSACDAAIDGILSTQPPTALPDEQDPPPVQQATNRPEQQNTADIDGSSLPLSMRGLHVSALGHGYRWGRWYLDCETNALCPMICYQRGVAPFTGDYWIPFDRIDEDDWVRHVEQKKWGGTEIADDLDLALCEAKAWRDWMMNIARIEIDRINTEAERRRRMKPAKPSPPREP